MSKSPLPHTPSFREAALNAGITLSLVSPWIWPRFTSHIHSYFAIFPNRKIVHISYKRPNGFEYLLWTAARMNQAEGGLVWACSCDGSALLTVFMSPLCSNLSLCFPGNIQFTIHTLVGLKGRSISLCGLSSCSVAMVYSRTSEQWQEIYFV